MHDLTPFEMTTGSAGETTGDIMKVDKHIDLGGCGMGMPVIRAWQAIRKLPISGVLHMSSSHP